jgi:uncharacterized damage-inducible protein DinB
MKSLFVMFAGYSRWANARLYAAAAKLSDKDYRTPHGAPLASLQGRLSHLLVADRVWMRRFTGAGPEHKSLDELPFDNLPALADARRQEDERIIAWVAGLTETALTATITYRPLSGSTSVTQPLGPVLAHFFNHQTHHRGQAHGLLTAIAGDKAAPQLDLIYFQRESGLGMN